MRRHTMQYASRHGHEPPHRTVDDSAETQPRRIEIVESYTRERSIRIDDRVRFAHHAVPFLPAFHIRANFANYAAELVTQNHRVSHIPAMLRSPHVQIAATNADRSNFEQN